MINKSKTNIDLNEQKKVKGINSMNTSDGQRSLIRIETVFSIDKLF